MKVVTAILILVAGVAGGFLVFALSQPIPPSLYKPELKREFTQAQRWQLDMELANELGSRVNSHRFNGPEGIDKRARWVEQEAVTYQIADLLQQIMNATFRSPIYNEPAFNQLVELGKQGDASASCFANLFYNHHEDDKIKRWKYSRLEVAQLAMKAKAASGHPLCAGIESRFYMTGEHGYPKDRAKAKPYIIEKAVAGFYGWQEYLAGTHGTSNHEIDPKEVALELCWMRAGNTFSPMADYDTRCYGYLHGSTPIVNIKNDQVEVTRVVVSEAIQVIARQWCEPTRVVTAQECANLESK